MVYRSAFWRWDCQPSREAVVPRAVTGNVSARKYYLTTEVLQMQDNFSKVSFLEVLEWLLLKFTNNSLKIQ